MEAVMSGPSGAAPAGIRPTAGVVHAGSPHGVSETTAILTAEIGVAGATLFAVASHGGEAARAGSSLRDTKLLISGNPKGGAAAMAGHVGEA
jgi:uncharacterized protein (DUF302 family)